MSGYSNFMAAVNPAAIEVERYGTPGPEERPGSPKDRQMRLAHEMERIWYWAQRSSTGLEFGPPMSDAEIAECAAEWRAHGAPKRQYTPKKKIKRPVIPPDRLLQIAVQAAERKAAS